MTQNKNNNKNADESEQRTQKRLKNFKNAESQDVEEAMYLIGQADEIEENHYEDLTILNGHFYDLNQTVYGVFENETNETNDELPDAVGVEEYR